MDKHRFTLEKYKGKNTRFFCPGCNHREKSFSRYIDLETNEYVSDNVGRCGRENNCGYHYTPKQFFEDNKHLCEMPPKAYNSNFRAVSSPIGTKLSFIPFDAFKLSLCNFDTNKFIQYLKSLFGEEETKKLIEKYYLGTSNYQFWNKEFPNYRSEQGATIFWQIDIENNLRTGKIMLYRTDNGKRIKDPFTHIQWVHTFLKIKDFNLQQCFFGEHLLRKKNKTVALVESEKTAIIASVYLPNFIWLATGSINNLKVEMFKTLRGRTVILFPDLKGFDKWRDKAKELMSIANVHVSDYLERIATGEEKKQGLDLADYLIKHDFRTFQHQENHEYKEQKLTPSDKKEIEKFETLDYNINTHLPAYIDTLGKLCIPTPLSGLTFTVYPNVESYNKRLCFPTIEPKNNYNITEMKSVLIDLKTLTLYIN